MKRRASKIFPNGLRSFFDDRIVVAAMEFIKISKAPSITLAQYTIAHFESISFLTSVCMLLVNISEIKYYNVTKIFLFYVSVVLV